MTNTKPWLWLLVASLALNVFLGVSLGTHFFRGPKAPPRPDGMLQDMAEALPEADARILRQAIEAHKSAFSERNDPKQHFDAMRQILQTEPFDPDAFARLSSEIRASHDRHSQAINDVLLEAVPKMSPEGRKALANRPPPPRPR